MDRYVFDDEGRLQRDEVDLERSQSHSTLIRQPDNVYISVTNGRCLFTFNPKCASPRAFAAALYALSDLPRMSVSIESIGDSLADVETLEFSSQVEAIDAVAKLKSQADSKRRHRFFRHADCQLDPQRHERLQTLLDIWREHGGQCELQAFRCSLRPTDRFILLRRDGNDRKLHVVKWGKGYQQLNKYWTSEIGPLRIEDQPDYDFGKWIVEAYHQVAETKTPLVETVYASIKWPREGIRRHVYRRAIVPLVDRREQTQHLLSVTVDELCG
jgi:hypothetical protein